MPIFQAKNAWKWGEKLTKDNKIVMKSRIDTIQTKEPISNRYSLNTFTKGSEEVISRDGKLMTKWNPNVVKDLYSKEYKLSVTKESIKVLYDLVSVINADEIKLNRIDICTDVDMDFTKNIKLLDFLHRCLCCNFKSGKGWDSTDKEDFKMSNIRFVNRDFNIEFYDKKKQSEAKHQYDTRLEIRAIRVKAQNFEYHIDKCIDLYNACSENVETIERVMTTKLIKLWYEEKEEQPNLRFTSFVTMYRHYFYSNEILKKVYKQTGLKQNFNVWLCKLRKTYKLDLYSKKDIEKFTKEIVKSLKLYKKL